MMGNNFKLRSVLILFVVSSIFILANFVGAATYDATGEWNLSISNGWTDGGDNCPLETDRTLSSTITQNGDKVTVIVHDSDGDITFSGSVTDNNYNISAFWIEDDGNEVTVSGTLILSSSTSGTGQMDISITEGAITCNKGMDITLTKQDVAPPVSGGDGGGGGCFIATAAYGSLMAPHVKILRDFRDRFLLHNSVGKGFTHLYYTYSPPMADFIAKHDNLRSVVRVSLLPIVGVSWVVLKFGPATTMALILLLISGFIGFVRFRRKYKT